MSSVRFVFNKDSGEDDDLSWENMISDLRVSITWRLNNSENHNLKWVHTILTYDPEDGFSFPEGTKSDREIYHELCRGNTVSRSKLGIIS